MTPSTYSTVLMTLERMINGLVRCRGNLGMFHIYWGGFFIGSDTIQFIEL
jgi:hypothetical protein